MSPHSSGVAPIRLRFENFRQADLWWAASPDRQAVAEVVAGGGAV